ncbi:hypothetical protein LTR17_025616 [Elasticomyces elasticus]|nr:hypothetical protein LTR17_025616 [Elasticomyces elasticus]
MPSFSTITVGATALLSLAAEVTARIPDRMPVKNSQVVHMLEAEQGVQWTQIDDNLHSLVFTEEAWVLWEGQYRHTQNTTDHLGNVRPDDEVFHEWENLSDEELEKRQKFILCYGSGTWARTFILAGLISGVCSGFNFGIGTGTRELLKRTGIYTTDGSESEGWFTHVKNVVEWSSAASCGAALGKVINDYCADYPYDQQNQPETTGGEAEDDVGNAFHVDSYAYYCSC